ncbi:FAD-binding protein [bacterium]|nr:FAD-binding protein [bacterium]
MNSRQLQHLRSLLGAQNVLTEPEDLWVYGHDATAMLRHLPEAVLCPANAHEIAAIIRFANEESLQLVPRGSGTGLSGGSIAYQGCLVLSLLRLNKILEIDRANMVATVEPGVITGQLHQAVEAQGLFYPPDPGSMKICTVGGNVAENAGGLRGLKYGVTRDYVMGLEVVLPEGEVMWTGSKCPKDVAGYDLKQLLVGSEGTLGVITRVLVKLLPKPKGKRTLLAVFPSMEKAAATVAAIIAVPIIPATLEFLDQITLRCVEEYAHIGLPTEAGAILLMESDGHPVVAEEEVQQMAQLARTHGATQVTLAQNEEEAVQLASARRMAFPALARMRPTTVLEDVSVPRSRLVEMVQAVGRIAASSGLMIGTFGHAGDGNLHPTILLDERNSDEVRRMEKAFEEICRAALDLGGTLTGEHGVGLLKRDFLERFTDPAALEMMRRFRETMDPRQVLNPGKMFQARPRREGQLPGHQQQCNGLLEGLRP